MRLRYPEQPDRTPGHPGLRGTSYTLAHLRFAAPDEHHKPTKARSHEVTKSRGDGQANDHPGQTNCPLRAFVLESGRDQRSCPAVYMCRLGVSHAPVPRWSRLRHRGSRQVASPRRAAMAQSTSTPVRHLRQFFPARVSDPTRPRSQASGGRKLTTGAQRHGDRGPPVQADQGLDRRPEHRGLARGRAAGPAVVGIGMAEERGDQIDHGEVCRGGRWPSIPPNRSIVLGVAGPRAVRAQVVIDARERDDGLAGRLVFAIGGGSVGGEAWHCGPPSGAENGTYRFQARDSGRTVAPGKVRKFCVRLGLSYKRAMGVEPTTASLEG